MIGVFIVFLLFIRRRPSLMGQCRTNSFLRISMFGICTCIQYESVASSTSSTFEVIQLKRSALFSLHSSREGNESFYHRTEEGGCCRKRGQCTTFYGVEGNLTPAIINSTATIILHILYPDLLKNIARWDTTIFLLSHMEPILLPYKGHVPIIRIILNLVQI